MVGTCDLMAATSTLTEPELARISELKYDGEGLAQFLGPSTCAAIQHLVALGHDLLLDTVAPWRRWLCGLTIVVGPEVVVAPTSELVQGKCHAGVS
jgi:hypothetical protein